MSALFFPLDEISKTCFVDCRQHGLCFLTNHMLMMWEISKTERWVKMTILKMFIIIVQFFFEIIFYIDTSGWRVFCFFHLNIK